MKLFATWPFNITRSLSNMKPLWRTWSFSKFLNNNCKFFVIMPKTYLRKRMYNCVIFHRKLRSHTVQFVTRVEATQVDTNIMSPHFHNITITICKSNYKLSIKLYKFFFFYSTRSQSKGWHIHTKVDGKTKTHIHTHRRKK